MHLSDIAKLLRSLFLGEARTVKLPRAPDEQESTRKADTPALPRAGRSHVLERIWAVAHRIATPADHPTPASGLSAIA